MGHRAYMSEFPPNVFDGDGAGEGEADPEREELERKRKFLERVETAKNADVQRKAGEDIGYLLMLARKLYGDLLENEEPLRPVVDQEIIAFMLSDLDRR